MRTSICQSHQALFLVYLFVKNNEQSGRRAPENVADLDRLKKIVGMLRLLWKGTGAEWYSACRCQHKNTKDCSQRLVRNLKEENINGCCAQKKDSFLTLRASSSMPSHSKGGANACCCTCAPPGIAGVEHIDSLHVTQSTHVSKITALKFTKLHQH